MTAHPDGTVLSVDEAVGFPTALDNTIIQTYKTCGYKAYQTYIQHWKGKDESVHLVAGKAFAEGLRTARVEFYENDASLDTAIAAGVRAAIREYGHFEPPANSPKDWRNVILAVDFALRDAWYLPHDSAKPWRGSSGKPYIEFSFAVPLVDPDTGEELPHPETGDPLLYTGRNDMLVSWSDHPWLLDDKTTGYLGDHWASQWRLSGQFYGYGWAAWQQGIPVRGAIIRGVSIQKTQMKKQQVMVYFSPELIERWYRSTFDYIKAMLRDYERGFWRQHWGHACSDFGGCPLQDVCLSPRPEALLEHEFERRVWNPVEMQEQKVA